MTDVEFELYHHGVKGMKWGVRRQKIRTAKADRNIGRTTTNRTASKMMLDAKNKSAEVKYYGGRTKVRDNFINRTLDKADARMLTRAKARNQVDYDISELHDKYSIARQKAKKDSSYKQTTDYKDAQKAYGKACVERMLLGDERYISIHTNMNTGMSRTKATGAAMVEDLLRNL